MLVHLDNSVLVDAFTGTRHSLPALIDAVSAGHLLTSSTLVLYEWLRGPRTEIERAHASRFLVSGSLAVFGEREAATAASLYWQSRRARQRQADLAIAACAIEHNAALWTLNPADFEDVPGLRLYRP